MRQPRLLGAGAQEHRRSTLDQWGAGGCLVCFLCFASLVCFLLFELLGAEILLCFVLALSLGCKLESCQSGQFSFLAYVLG